MKSFLKKALVIGAISLAPAAFAVDMTGAGATFPYPIYAKWAEAFKAKTGSNLNYQSIGSSGGIKQIKAKTVDFGATDNPVKFDELEKDGMVQFPAIIGGVDHDGVVRKPSFIKLVEQLPDMGIVFLKPIAIDVLTARTGLALGLFLQMDEYMLA